LIDLLLGPALARSAAFALRKPGQHADDAVKEVACGRMTVLCSQLEP
jgi:hypothetical protein